MRNQELLAEAIFKILNSQYGADTGQGERCQLSAMGTIVPLQPATTSTVHWEIICFLMGQE